MGSGTTLIAAETNGAGLLRIELKPGLRSMWQVERLARRFTGQSACLKVPETSFAELNVERNAPSDAAIHASRVSIAVEAATNGRRLMGWQVSPISRLPWSA